ncbi:helix-turn-helix transcriptional regulator [Microbispora rosea]|uniref:helix-turn-helix transcriptional regulator n=1 Tax=Microbispora rosea TaxID=58117 RepID=UPI0037A193D1
MTRRIIPAKVRELRRARGMSTTQLAAAMDISEVTVRTWEAGKYSPAAGKLPRLAEVLDTPVEEFTTDRCPCCGQLLPGETGES